MSEYGITIGDFKDESLHMLPSAHVRYWLLSYTRGAEFADVVDFELDDAARQLRLIAVPGETPMSLAALLDIMDDYPDDYEIACWQETSWDSSEYRLAETVVASPEENTVFLQDEN